MAYYDKVSRMVKIKLSPSELEWCQSHAEGIVAHYGGNNTQGSGAYNHNRIDSNLVGVKSEKASEVWLKRYIPLEDMKLHYQNYETVYGVGDINIYGQSLEIKGLRPHQWEKFKRMIPPRQLHHYVRDKAIVVWTTATGDSKKRDVHLKGWNYAHEVQSKGVPIKTICDNIWLEDDADMRSMDSLIPILRSLK